MSRITSLVIPSVEGNYSAHNLMDAFYLSGIATVREVAYLPYMYENSLYYRAFIEIHEWHDTHDSLNFVNSLKFNNITRFQYKDECSFIVKIDDAHWMVPLSKCHRTISPLIHESFGMVVTSHTDDCDDYIDDCGYEEYCGSFQYRIENDLVSEYEYFEEEKETDEDRMRREEEEEEYEQYLQEQDFIQDAEDYHDEIMEKRLQKRKTMTSQQFREWEITSGFGKTKKECQYEIYLKTGNVLC